MTASVLKQDPNTKKGSEERYVFGQLRHNLQIFRVIPFVKLENLQPVSCPNK